MTRRKTPDRHRRGHRSRDRDAVQGSPRRAWFERLEWAVLPDASTAATLQSGEVDLLDAAALDPAPQLAQSPNVVVRNTNAFGPAPVAFDAAKRLAPDDVAIIPLGFWRPNTAFRKDTTGVLECDY